MAYKLPEKLNLKGGDVMLSRKEEQSLSKLMSKILRHTPHEFGLSLDHHGYCRIEDLLQAIRSEKRWISVEQEDIKLVVNNCDKQRYEIMGEHIRAKYGHSSERLNYKALKPPEVLYHGTNSKAADRIFAEGIKPMGRKYVHLSEKLDFAIIAGKRRGELVIIQIDTSKALLDGVEFYLAENGVWLADYIAPQYLALYE